MNVLTDAARLAFGPNLARFMLDYPEVKLEIVVQDEFIDIVGGSFDAGIRVGGSVPEDMIAVPVGADLRWIMVASPDYLAQGPQLKTPSDLSFHRCVGQRTGTGAIYHWELEKGSDCGQVSVEWAIVVNETALAIEIAETGTGIAYCIERRVQDQLKSGVLKEVLPKWSSFGPAFHIYYSSRRQVPIALRALISFLKNEVR
ncbi:MULTISPECIES: LysR substrate-binding domain-containing protein [unclassified Bradyrhizobium]